MTKKTFEMIARAIKAERYADTMINESTGASIKSYRLGGNHALDDLARRLADEFAHENPRFDRAKFLDACGTKGAINA